jgi:Leucine-rich repeat (LRR) protein
MLVNLKALTVLNINQNQLNSIGRFAFANLNELSYLDISNNQIGFIDGQALDGTCKIGFFNLNNNPIFGHFIYTKEGCRNSL